MKSLFLFLVLPFSLFGQEYSQDEAELILLNKAIYKAYVIEHNTDFFAQATSEDFVLVAGIGIVESKEQAIQGVSNLKITSFELTEDRVILKKNMGIVVGAISLKGTIMGRPAPPKMRYMSVFVKEDGGWKLQSRSMTPIRTMKKM